MNNLLAILILFSISLVLLVAAHHIRLLKREIESLQDTNRFLHHEIQYWRNRATGGAFADFIESLKIEEI